jgi:hypothetical protein
VRRARDETLRLEPRSSNRATRRDPMHAHRAHFAALEPADSMPLDGDD